jgi:chemotaxis protein MotB
MGAIRVLVVDDSVVIRKVLSEALSADPEIEVAGTAADGSIALSKIPLLHPDLITLDVEMPGMSGLETLIAIRKTYPRLPVIMFSTLTERGAATTLEALSLGASDYATKPQNTGSVEETRARIRSDLIPRVKGLCRKERTPPVLATRRTETRKTPLVTPAPSNYAIEVVAIGTSTGGPNALAALLPLLAADFPAPIVIVVSYADFITLLFAFFVVLYSSSQVDKRKVGRLALAIQVAFQELGVFDTSNTKVPLSESEAIPFTSIQAVENVQRTGDMERFVQPMKGVLSPAAANASLSDVQTQLEKALAPEIKDHFVDVHMRKEGVVVSLREMGFYDSGSATMLPSAMNAIDRLAAVIAPRGESLRIEGHTDNVPIHNAHFPSNWELSTARATELVQLFIYRYQVMPSRLSAAGYAEFHPVADNSTADGRSHNRRIDIVILNPVFVERSPILAPGPAVNPLSGPASSAPTPSPGARPSGR